MGSLSVLQVSILGALVVLALCGIAQAGGRQQHQQQAPNKQSVAHKRSHGWGWGSDYELQTIFFLGIPLIIIPLIFLWPYFLYSVHNTPYGHGYGHGGGWGWGRSSNGAPGAITQKKTDELAQQIVPHL